MKKNLFFAFATLIFIMGCSFSTAKVTEIKMTKSVDPTTQGPTEVVTQISPDVSTLFCTAKLSNAPTGTSVKTEFFYLEGEEQSIAVVGLDEVTGTRYISFELNPPASGWPLGKYKAVVYLNNERVGETPFSVIGKDREEAAASVTQPSQKRVETLPASTGQYRTYSSPIFGFSVEFPTQWIEGTRPNEAVAMLYLANQLNDPIANINIQVIPVTLDSPSLYKEAINLVAQQLIDQIVGSDGSRIVNDYWTQVLNKEGREIVFRYYYNGKPLKQRQFLTFNQNKVFSVIYTAETSVYEKHLFEYEKAIETLTFFNR